MKATELRIGNLILVNGEIQEVYELPLPDNCTKENTSGIPLTEEWLMKFGFVSNPYMDTYLNGFVTIDCDKTRGTLDLYIQGVSKKLEYVHQCQNIYFALTGEELEIKLKTEL